MKHKLSISGYGKKSVIAFLIVLLCIERPIVICSDNSAELEVVGEEEELVSLPINNFAEKCEQRCYEQVGLLVK
jgi:hypothetical protein